MPTLFLLEETETVTLTIPQASSLFRVPYFDDDSGLSAADRSAALGGYHYDYNTADETFITVPQAASIFGIPYLDGDAVISGADGAQIMGGYRYNYSLTPEVEADPGETGASAGGRYRRGNRKNYRRHLDRYMRPLDPPKPKVVERYTPPATWSHMGDNVVDMPRPPVVQQLGVDWLSMVPGSGMSDAQKRRIALAYLMLE